ncbi:MAG: polysaccharide deacetylase family protein [Acetobacteraceae bacterium]|nr:polysaccharide deacetylase family protein [Acetobacteraceae bacterium]
MQRRGLLAAGLGGLAAPALAQRGPVPGSTLQRGCAGTLYLTIDTGWSREAELIAEVMRRHGVRATLFVANEPTHRGDRQLEESWASFWRARAAEGHVFATHTWRHWYFRGDRGPGQVSYIPRTGGGGEVLDQQALCAELYRPIEAIRRMVPQATILPIWRAPGGITTPGTIRMAEACGLRHQGWTRNGFLGDELPADTHPNAALLERNLRNLRDGDVLVMHWGVRSRREPFGLVFEALITGLLQRGFCFAPLPPEGIRT